MYSFKDFLTVDYTGTGDEQLAKNAKRRKTDDTSGDLTASNDPTVDEALTQAQRQKMRAVFRKNKAKIKRGRDIAKRRLASDEKLKAKAMKKARDIITKKITKDKSKAELPFAARANIEKQLEKRKGAIQRMAKKLFPKVKKADREKMRPITPAKGDTLK
jgi:hypothetical protein